MDYGLRGRVAVVARAVDALASDGSSFVTGEALAAEGGLLAR